jgi:hypothetical protein
VGIKNTLTNHIQSDERNYEPEKPHTPHKSFISCGLTIKKFLHTHITRANIWTNTRIRYLLLINISNDTVSLLSLVGEEGRRKVVKETVAKR